jgi:hypothetical protein
VSQRRQWDRDAQPTPAWARNLVRRAYLVVRDGTDPAGGELVFETSYPCAVGDLVSIPELVPDAGTGPWEIVAREAAPAPYVARLVVAPAGSSSG